MTERMILTLAILGGTGKEGRALAARWAKAGYHVIIGSRSRERADKAATSVNERLGEDLVHGMENPEAADACDIAVLTVPFDAHRSTLEAMKDHLQGKLLVDVSVPLQSGDPSVVQMPKEGSAAQEAKAILGAGVDVAAAFQNVSHVHLRRDEPVPCDVLVCGDPESARQQVLQLVKAAGLVGWDAGPLQNAIVVEGLAAILVGINKRYKIKSAGIRITGEQAPE
jgi:8-hydroxy-5-deazaflavin:NADPH oxidoreductase